MTSLFFNDVNPTRKNPLGGFRFELTNGPYGETLKKPMNEMTEQDCLTLLARNGKKADEYKKNALAKMFFRIGLLGITTVHPGNDLEISVEDMIGKNKEWREKYEEGKKEREVMDAPAEVRQQEIMDSVAGMGSFVAVSATMERSTEKAVLLRVHTRRSTTGCHELWFPKRVAKQIEYSWWTVPTKMLVEKLEGIGDSIRPIYLKHADGNEAEYAEPVVEEYLTEIEEENRYDDRQFWGTPIKRVR